MTIVPAARNLGEVRARDPAARTTGGPHGPPLIPPGLPPLLPGSTVHAGRGQVRAYTRLRLDPGLHNLLTGEA